MTLSNAILQFQIVISSSIITKVETTALRTISMTLARFLQDYFDINTVNTLFIFDITFLQITYDFLNKV